MLTFLQLHMGASTFKDDNKKLQLTLEWWQNTFGELCEKPDESSDILLLQAMPQCAQTCLSQQAQVITGMQQGW